MNPGNCPIVLFLAALGALPAATQPRRWMDEPVRLVQTNLRETDAALDPARVARQIAEFPANALLFGMGGIVAYYPTKVEFHYPSPHMPPGEIQMRLYQNVAPGAGPAFTMHGTPEQEGPSALEATRPDYEWHADHADLYAGQESAARVLLLGARNNSSCRRFFPVLSEQHIPFVVSDSLQWLDGSRAFDPPIEMHGIEVALEAKFRRARSARLNRSLPVRREGAYGRFTLPELGAYEVVILE